MIDIVLYRAVLAEIDEQINTVIKKHEEVMTGLLKILDKCRKKLENGGLSLTTSSRTLSSSSSPSPAAPARKWGPVKELKFSEKLVEGATITEFTIWRRRMQDYLALPEITADHYPSTKDVIPYINSQLDSWWYGRLEHRLTDSVSIDENFDRIKSEVAALDPLINRRDRLLSTRQEKGS